MADVMRATTPINNRNIIQPTKEHREVSSLPMDFQDVTKVKSTLSQSEMLGQNNVLRENGSSTVLYTLLKDPEVTSSFLKNIFFLREIVGLMPLNNDTQTEEMEQLMERLLLSPEEIPQEMKNQENISTMFKGELFDTLRQILQGNGKPVNENISETLNQIPLPTVKDGTQQQTAEGEILQAPQQQIAEGEILQAPQQQIAEGEILQTPQQQIAEGEILQAPQQQIAEGEILQTPQQQTAQGEVLQTQQQIAQGQESLKDKVANFFNIANNNITLPEEVKNMEASEIVKQSFTMPENETSQKEIQDNIVNLLKSINAQQNKGSFLDSVKNNLLFLRDAFPQNSDYANKLDQLAKAFAKLSRGDIPKEAYHDAKLETLGLLESLKNSVLYNGDMDKICALVRYNLSRYNDNENLIAESFSRLLSNIPDDKLKGKLTADLLKYLETAEKTRGTQPSKTMSALADILQKQSENIEGKMLNSDSIDKIVHGLLSSPSNFTPLLHYVVPVDNGETQAMAEIWINPNGQEDIENVEAVDSKTKNGKKLTHMLVVFEIDGIGKFETELFAEDKSLNLTILCPEEYVSDFKGVNADIRKACESTGYRFKNITVSELKSPRSLIEVFRSLPARRSGINVTI